MLTHEGVCSGVVAVFQDLTEVREMERRARRNETLAEVGALSARIAHELRNGLNPISGLGGVLCSASSPSRARTRALMELISASAVRLNRFVERSLELLARARLAGALELERHLAEFCETSARDPRRPAAASSLRARARRGA